MAVELEFLKTTPYFATLNTAELSSVGKLFFEKDVGRGEILIFEGDPAQVLYFVVSGVTKVFKTSADGREQILQLIRPGESFNDVPVFSGETSLTSVEALGPVVLYGLNKNDLEVILRDYSQVALNLIGILSQKVQHLLSLVEDLSFRHVTARVAKIILEYASDGVGQNRHLTQQEMAAMAGTAREVVGRALKSLEGEGIIRLEHHRIVITNKEALRVMIG
ncbi:Crp/Fnr family transcriptional regulator [Chloroflexota bacterium]